MSTDLQNQIQRLIEAWHKSVGVSCFPGLFDSVCPIPFFGNIEANSNNNDNHLVFTLGANPSNKEFLNHKRELLNKDNNRFDDICKKGKLLSANELWSTCNQYFERRPYAKWFGAENGSKIEGLLNTEEIDASYYWNINKTNNKTNRSVHIDLMPFPTLCKFTEIQNNPFFQMLIVSYGIPLIAQLIKEFHPHKVICISTFVCESLLETIPGKNGVKYYTGNYGGVPFIGSSIYYPNSTIKYNPEDVAKQMNSYLKIKCQQKKNTFLGGIDFRYVLTQYLK